MIQQDCPKGDCEAGRELGSVEELPKGGKLCGKGRRKGLCTLPAPTARATHPELGWAWEL